MSYDWHVRAYAMYMLRQRGIIIPASIWSEHATPLLRKEKEDA